MAVVHHNTATKPLIVDGAGPDTADNWVADHIEKTDMCITSVISLADCGLQKMRVLGFRGHEFTDSMIGNALATRT